MLKVRDLTMITASRGIGVAIAVQHEDVPDEQDIKRRKVVLAELHNGFGVSCGRIHFGVVQDLCNGLPPCPETVDSKADEQIPVLVTSDILTAGLRVACSWRARDVTQGPWLLAVDWRLRQCLRPLRLGMMLTVARLQVAKVKSVRAMAKTMETLEECEMESRVAHIRVDWDVIVVSAVDAA